MTGLTTRFWRNTRYGAAGTVGHEIVGTERATVVGWTLDPVLAQLRILKGPLNGGRWPSGISIQMSPVPRAAARRWPLLGQGGK